MTAAPHNPAPPAAASGSPLRAAETGGCVPGLDAPAFTLSRAARLRLPVLVSVPHAGRAYPPAVLAKLRNPALAQLRLEDRYVDRLAAEIVRQTGAGLLLAHAPRALIDLNRAADDIDWDMVEGGRPADAPGDAQGNNRRARSGLGLIPRRLPGSGEIWRGRLTQGELQARISGVHHTYHAALAAELNSIRDEWGVALLIDLHSMPPLRTADGDPAASVVLGDRFGASCHQGIIGRAVSFLNHRNCAATQNRPYSGGYILDRHGAPRDGIHALQVEVCRATYLDAQLSEPGAGLPAVAAMLADLVRELGAEAALLGGGEGLLQAAE